MAIPPIKVEVSADTSKLKDGLDKGTAQLDKFSKASQSSTQKLGQFNDALAQTSGRLGESASRLQTSITNFKNFAAVVGKVPAILGSVAIGLGAIVAAGFIVASTAAIKFADKLKEISDEARDINMPIEELSRLKFAADAAGSGAETLTSGLSSLKEAMEAVKSGEEDNSGAKALELLGIKALDASGNLRPMSEVLSEVAGKFETYADGANKTALANAIFGDGVGSKLVPMLNRGSEGIAALKAKADELGVTMSGRSTQSSEKYRESLEYLKGSISGAWNYIGEKFIPILADLVKIIADVIPKLINFGQSVYDWIEVKFKTAAAAGTLLKDVIAGLFSPEKGTWEAAFKKYNDAIERIQAEPPRQLTIPVSGGGRPQAPAIPTKPEAAATKGGGGGGAEYDPNEALLRRLSERMKIIEESYMTEEQKLVSKQERERALFEEAHKLRMQQIGENNEEKFTAEAEHIDRMEALNESHQKSLAKLEQNRQNTTLKATANFFGSLVTLMDAFGKKNTALAKAFGIAEAIINTYVGVTQALKALPPPASYIAAAAVLAKGLAAVAVIARTNTSGGGNSAGGGSGAISSAGGGGGGAASTATQGTGRAVYVNLQGTTFGREQVRELVEHIGQYQADGGRVIFS